MQIVWPDFTILNSAIDFLLVRVLINAVTDRNSNHRLARQWRMYQLD